MTLILTDENFEERINNSNKPVLVDFFAIWCEPCSVLTPILDKVAEDLSEKIVLAKVDVNSAPRISRNFNVDRIPMVVLLNKGRMISGFIGVRTENDIKQWISDTLAAIPSGDLTILSDNYAKQNGFKLNSDSNIVKRVISGLLANEQKYGKRYCPCRRISGDEEADSKNICPCRFHKEEIEKDGHCFCNLFIN